LTEPSSRHQGGLPFSRIISGNNDTAQLHSVDSARLLSHAKAALMKRA
jgi:hypothetical protein